jgi:transmembrane sensor
MINDHIASLIARKLNGEITAAELQELTEHFKTHPADQYFEELLSSYWNSQPGTSLHDSSADDHFSRILKRADEDEENEQRGAAAVLTNETPNRKRRILIRRISVAITVAAGIALLIWNFSPAKRVPAIKASEPENVVIAKKGMRSQLLLPDGSRVWLNADSKLTYSDFHNDTVRQVELEGEAYFDVVKNPGKAFIVHTSSFDVRVLGTAFDVKSYPGEPTFETFLIRGMVEVTRRGQPHAKKDILKPLEKLVLPVTVLQKTDTTDGKLADSKNISGPKRIIAPKNLPDSSISEISWVYDKLSFDGESFRDMARKMERWFNVKITFHDDYVEADTKRYHWSFTNQTIQQALQELKIIIPFSYRITGNGSEVIIDKE